MKANRWVILISHRIYVLYSDQHYFSENKITLFYIMLFILLCITICVAMMLQLLVRNYLALSNVEGKLWNLLKKDNKIVNIEIFLYNQFWLWYHKLHVIFIKIPVVMEISEINCLLILFVIFILFVLHITF